MAKTKLFEAWSFRLQQPAPFDDPKYAGSKSMGFSQYNTSSTAQKSTLHAPTMRALLAYAKLVSATENGQSVDGLGAIGHQGTTYRISEYRSANKTDCVVFNPVTGKFNAAQVEDGTQALKPYSVGAGNGTGSGLLFCLMPVLNEDDEFRQKFQEFVSLLESGWADMDAAFECALTLCDNVYRRIENSKQLGSDGVKISIPKELLKGIAAERIQVELTKMLCGKGVTKVLEEFSDVIAIPIPEILPMFHFEQRNPHHDTRTSYLSQNQKEESIDQC